MGGEVGGPWGGVVEGVHGEKGESMGWRQQVVHGVSRVGQQGGPTGGGRGVHEGSMGGSRHCPPPQGQLLLLDILYPI